YIHVSLFKKLDGKKVFEGTLKELLPDQLTLTVKDKSRKFDQVIDRQLIASARLAIEF
ncbi:ribosome maturation factor RimP, partial [Lacticaseibacillus paracasei]